MAHSWNDRFHQIIQQTRVIQIAMNSIENQSLEKLEIRKTCMEWQSLIVDKYTIPRYGIRNSYMQKCSWKALIGCNWKALIGCKSAAGSGEMDNFSIEFAWAGPPRPAFRVQLIYIVGRIRCGYNWGDKGAPKVKIPKNATHPPHICTAPLPYTALTFFRGDFRVLRAPRQAPREYFDIFMPVVDRA